MKRDIDIARRRHSVRFSYPFNRKIWLPVDSSALRFYITPSRSCPLSLSFSFSLWLYRSFSFSSSSSSCEAFAQVLAIFAISHILEKSILIKHERSEAE